MYQDVLAVVNGCGQCYIAKKRRLNVPRKQLHLLLRKLSAVHMDIYGLNALSKVGGQTCVLSLIDVLTGFVVFMPLTNSKHAIISGWFSYFGLPDSFHCDNNILTNAGKEWCDALGITYSNSANYAHHQAGKVERVHRELTEGLKILKQQIGLTSPTLYTKTWVQWIKVFAWKHNAMIVESLKKSPYELMYGREARALFHEDWLTLRSELEPAVYEKPEQMMKKLREDHWHEIHRRTTARSNYVDALPGDLVRWFPDELVSKYHLRKKTYKVLDCLGNVLQLQDGNNKSF